MHALARTRRRLRLPGVLAVTAVALLALPARGALATTRCSDPAGAGGSPVTVLRLLNAARAENGVAPLHLDPRLARSARRHSCDMVAHHYFAHDSRSGARFSARIARTGWMRMRGHRRWTVGETLAWGTGPLATPRSIALAWLQSPPHRHILLERRFRVVGIGIVSGTPIDASDSGGRTYTADFGT